MENPENILTVLTEKSLDVALWALIATLIIAILNGRKANRIEREENYIQLEMAANDLFRFEAEHAKAIEPFQKETRPKTVPSGEAAIRSFYYQTLNLFEIATRLRASDRFGKQIFGTWVVWFHDTLNEWYFRQEWPSLRENYSKEMRAIFDPMVEGFDLSEDPDIRKDKFFEHVAGVLNCPIVRDWRKDLRTPLRQEKLKISPPRIRPATLKDQEPVATMLAASIQSQNSYISHGDYFAGRTVDGKSFVKSLKTVISAEISAESDTSSEYLLAVDEKDQVIGVAAYFYKNNGHQTYCILDDIAVDPNARGQGIGQSLFDAVEQKAKSQKAAKILLESGISNHPAHRFFRSNGFQTLSKTFHKDL